MNDCQFCRQYQEENEKQAARIAELQEAFDVSSNDCSRLFAECGALRKLRNDDQAQLAGNRARIAELEQQNAGYCQDVIKCRGLAQSTDDPSAIIGRLAQQAESQAARILELENQIGKCQDPIRQISELGNVNSEIKRMLVVICNSMNAVLKKTLKNT